MNYISVEKAIYFFKRANEPPAMSQAMGTPPGDWETWTLHRCKQTTAPHSQLLMMTETE